MLTAKEARSLAEDYAFSEEWFCNTVLSVVEKYAKYGKLELKLEDCCNQSEGFDLEHLERLKELGYAVEFVYESRTLILGW